MTEADRRPRAAWIGGAAAPATRTGVLWAGLRADAVWVGAAKVLGGAMFVAVNLWAARHLDPAAFGVFALSITSLLLVDNICGSALDLAVVRLSGDAGTELGHGLSPAERAAIVLKVGAGTVLFVLVMLFGEGLGGLVFQAREHAWVVRLAVVAGVGMLLLRSALVHFQARLAFNRYGATELAHTLLRLALIAVVFRAGSASPTTLLAAYAAAPALVLAVLIARAEGGTWIGRWCDLVSLGKVWRIARVAAVTFGVGALVARLDVYLLGVVRGADEVGVLALAVTLAACPEMIGAYLAPVFTPRIVRACREGTFGELFARVQGLLISGSVAIGLIGLVLMGPIVSALVPAEYGAASPVALALLPGALASFVTFPLTFYFLIFARPRLFLVMDLLTQPFLIAAYVYVGRRYGALGIAWVSTAARVTKAAVAQVLAARLAFEPEYMRAFAARLSAGTADAGLEPGRTGLAS